ncbi:related to MPH1 - Member of the DEAH family of helicases [Melanopsichium pennsylvanicum]|uniref:ATP-dependent DNA helicase n=2 Tax=Melanopsichium pennsylvanicum TaxID=63383 RepID=A0AAJ5C369_9BASI|nr:related to MPH1-Member of the DEAH family of helicases [Melanopsichium pennsylvanicum 4]SNX82291.1 related to MPH1 - Member of the DEAH family of helicases [Melanopsichium pennsylvanicum]
MALPSDKSEDLDDFDDFGIDDLDDSALLQLDQIENKLVSNGTVQQTNTGSHAINSAGPVSSRIQTKSSFSITRAGLAQGEAQLQSLDTNGGVAPWTYKAGASAKASTSARPMQRVDSTGSSAAKHPASSGASQQMTLFGKPVNTPSQSKITDKVVLSGPGQVTIFSQIASTSATQNGYADDANSAASSRPLWERKVGTKSWDREAYLHRENAKNREKDEFGAPIDVDALEFDDEDTVVKTGTNGKCKAKRDWDADSKYQNVALPAPVDARRNLPPAQAQKCKIDLEAAKTWIYPTNMDKRDYQYNIVQKALFNNVLVALPTGLGKTFIAAVVILNFFRWYPDGKMVFLAPSRPLVDQQKTACHKICGLPWNCAIDLTGSTLSARRGEFWQTKRIFYMTPQTLENDIIKDSCDPRDIVCVVVDEAHRARGKYAYGSCIGRIMEVNAHFRVLALSATPGKDSDSVQEVVDQLHINQIEIRTEEAIDVQRYTFRKREEIVNVTLGKDLNKVKDQWAKLMQVQMDPLMKAGLLRNQDPVFLHPFAVNAIAKDRSRAGILAKMPWLRSNISELAQMALSMQYLMEQSATMFYNRLKERSMGYNIKGKKTASAKQQIYANTNATFAQIMRELEMMQDRKGRILHPKMIKLRNVLIEHFDSCKAEQVHNAEAYAESGHDVLGNTPNSDELANFVSSSQADTRVMVFCSYRECCDEIVSYLNDSGFRATEFVGQSKAKSGKKGMSQKDQERVISDFKAGRYNVLVATSIGEEGLDIGSVDLTACYEAVKDSIRMLQRIGRTGRKREGKIVVLISEGREQHNWQHSKDKYKAVQKEVDSRLYVELFDDVDRMVPDDISPQPVLQQVEQPEFEPSMVSEGKATKTSRAIKEPRPKKNPRRNMPEGGSIIEGFRKASTLAKRKQDGDDDSNSPPSNETHSQKVRRLLAVSNDEDESDFEKENLSLFLRGSRERAKVAATKRVDTSSPELSPPRRFRVKTANLSAGSSTTDSIYTPPVPSTSSSSRPLGTVTRGKRLGAGLRSSGRSSITSSGQLALHKCGENSPPPLGSFTSNGDENLFAKSPRSAGIAKAVARFDDEDDEFGDSFAIGMSMENALARVEAEAAAKGKAQRESHPDKALLEPAFWSPIPKKDVSEPILLSPATPSPKREDGRVKAHPLMEALMKEDAERAQAEQDKEKGSASKSTQKGLESPVEKSSMGPPDSIPRRAGVSRAKRVILESPDTDSGTFAPAVTVELDHDRASSSPIKAPAKRGGRPERGASSSTAFRRNLDASPTVASTMSRSRVRVRIAKDDSDSDNQTRGLSGALKTTSRTKTGKTSKSSTAAASSRGRRNQKRKITNSPTSRALFRYEAERSTDESEHGESDENDSGFGSSAEYDSDREAVGDFLPTQAPRGYDQNGVYLQSMMSQRAPPEFSRVPRVGFPGVGGRFGEQTTPTRRVKRAQIPSSESRGRVALGSEDMYSEDSFVVNDEDEIVYDSDTDALPDSSQF